MNREIKFRGLRTDGKGWAIGFYNESILKEKKYFIMADLLSREFVQVIPETVGQYTGLKDKNDVEIYEGDIIQVVNGAGKSFVVQYKFASFWKVETSHLSFSTVLDDHYESFIVIGNIHENAQTAIEYLKN